MIKLAMLAATQFKNHKHLIAFKKDEDGLALTEYLILLGLLTAVVILAVTVFGGELGESWAGWANWLVGAAVDAPGGDAATAVSD